MNLKGRLKKIEKELLADDSYYRSKQIIMQISTLEQQGNREGIIDLLSDLISINGSNSLKYPK